MVKKYVTIDEDVTCEKIDEFAMGMIAHTQDPKKVAYTLSYYTYGKKEYVPKTKLAWALLQRYDCHVIVTIEKLLEVANKVIEEYYPKLLDSKKDDKASKNKVGRPPTKKK